MSEKKELNTVQMLILKAARLNKRLEELRKIEEDLNQELTEVYSQSGPLYESRGERLSEQLSEVQTDIADILDNLDLINSDPLAFIEGEEKIYG